MAAVSKVFVARMAGLPVLGPDGETVGRVRDVVITMRISREQPRVLGLVVELATRRRIFVPMLRVTAIEPTSINLNTGNVSLRRFVQRPTEVLVLAQVLDSPVQAESPELTGDVVVTDVAIEATRTRDWVVSKVAVRPRRARLGRRGAVTVVSFDEVEGLTRKALAQPGQNTDHLMAQFQDMRAADVAHALRELPTKRRMEVAEAFDDERLADVVQELPEKDQTELLMHLKLERAADVLEAMDPDDAADLLGELPDSEAEALLGLMDPEESEPVRRLLQHSPDTAGGMMTPQPLVLTPNATVAEALARARNPDLTPALASIIFVVRPPTATPTGRYLGCVHLQRLLREPPANLVSGVLDTGLPTLSPTSTLSEVTRFFATYNLVCGPVVDEENHMLGAVAVDDLLDHLLPEDWRLTETHLTRPDLNAEGARHA
ncbi:CBS domain-containing protein [Rhodococcus sp. X156]|uniref:magnesium transporter MgtE N-terminal domain-containing protein n=1 Tax=Rhodococcus sp. X156 TaxID=2499145 RepID=UPI000FD73B26|nr:CBS domain-containing protein [Rhodococcus sp. X156]